MPFRAAPFVVATLALLLPVILPVPALAEPDVRVLDPWARASAGMGRTGAAYLTIHNEGNTADRLVSAATPVAGRVELHTHIHDGGVMRMRAVDAIEAPPGTKVELKPGGLHVMLLDLAAPLRAGEHVTMTFTFETSGDVTVKVPVLGVGAMAPGEKQGIPHGAGGQGGMHRH